MVFIPASDVDGEPIVRGQAYWVEECLAVVGLAFGGGTAFPPGRGVWRNDETGELLFEDTVVVNSYVSEADLEGGGGQALYDFAMRLGSEGNQGEVGIFVDGEYFGFRDFESYEQNDPKSEGEEAA